MGKLSRIRQWVESVFDTIIGQLILDDHGGRTILGVNPDELTAVRAELEAFVDDGFASPPRSDQRASSSADSRAFVTRLGMRSSMGRTGVCWDCDGRVVLRHLEDRVLLRRPWTSKKRAKLELGTWIEDRYNRRRRTASSGQITPVVFAV